MPPSHGGRGGPDGLAAFGLGGSSIGTGVAAGGLGYAAGAGPFGQQPMAPPANRAPEHRLPRQGSLPGAGAGAPGDPVSAGLAALLQSQALLMQRLAAQPNASDPLTGSAPATASPVDLAPGAGIKGMEALERFRSDFELRPAAYTAAVQTNAL